MIGTTKETTFEEEDEFEVDEEENSNNSEEIEESKESVEDNFHEEDTTSEELVNSQGKENNQVEDNEKVESSEENTDNSTSKEGISYTSESGISIEGEIDFDMDLKEEISDEDKIEAIKYAAKLDIPYLLGLISDGITDEDKALVSEHMRENLTEEEYSKTKNLIFL